MRKLATREKVLLGLLAVVAVILVLRGGGGLGFGGSQAPNPDLVGPLGDPPEVHMTLLARRAEGYDPNGRNLFGYYVPPRKAPPPPPPRPPIERKPTPKPIPKRVKAVPPSAPKPPAPSFAYIGFIGPKDAKIGVFDGGNEVKLARVGETIEEPFELKEFTFDGVVLAYAAGKFSGQTTELKKRIK